MQHISNETRKKVVREHIQVNNEFYVAPVYNEMIEAGKKIVFNNAGAKMYGLGIPEDLNYFMEQEVSKRVFTLGWRT